MNFDRFSDPDSLSFNSLSRSSSLIQFESLERQIQTGEQQSFGGSTPSLNNANALSADTSKAGEHAPPLHAARNYFDIEKIDFTSALYMNCQEQTSSSESSCSTDNSIYYSDHQQEVEGAGAKEAQRSQRTQTAKVAFRRKNSVENLSEDSGYGDLPSFKCRSKSIPNLNNDQLLGIDEPLDNHRSLNDISKRSPCKAAEMAADIQRDCQNAFGAASSCRSKINAIHATSEQRSAEHASSATLDASKNSPNAENGWLNDNRSHVLSAAQPNRSASARSADELSVQSRNSTSLPDIYAHFVSDYGNSVCSPQIGYSLFACVCVCVRICSQSECFGVAFQSTTTIIEF